MVETGNDGGGNEEKYVRGAAVGATRTSGGGKSIRKLGLNMWTEYG